MNAFQGLKKLQKTLRKKLKALYHVWIAIALTKIFLFSLFKFVAVVAPDRTDEPTSKKYVTVKPNLFQVH